MSNLTKHGEQIQKVRKTWRVNLFLGGGGVFFLKHPAQLTAQCLFSCDTLHSGLLCANQFLETPCTVDCSVLIIFLRLLNVFPFLVTALCTVDCFLVLAQCLSFS